MAVEESRTDHGETPGNPEPQTYLRPRSGRMVRLRIAIAGTRGIPARYGGFETFAEELSARLVERGHQVWVYCRPGNADVSSAVAERAGRPRSQAHRIVLPAFRHKYFETVSH